MRSNIVGKKILSKKERTYLGYTIEKNPRCSAITGNTHWKNQCIKVARMIPDFITQKKS